MKTNYHLLTEEQQDLRLMVREFADKEIIPTAKECDIRSFSEKPMRWG